MKFTDTQGVTNTINNLPNISTIILNGEIIENVTDFEYLGIVLDNHLFDKHEDYIVDKIPSKLGILCKTCRLFDLRTAKML